jgi:Ca-activated chloride channel family protein
MKRPRWKSFILILFLIVVTGAAMAYTGRGKHATPQPPPPPPIVFSGGGILNLSGHLVQTHVLKGSPGRVSLELMLSAGPGGEGHPAGDRGIDFVVVLDRSGSMQGPKLEYARQALLSLVAGLTERDRFAFFSYSDSVQKHCDLLAVTDLNRRLMQSAVNGIYSSGATNLGEGLRAGIDMIAAAGRPGHPGRVILISDGLANRGVTDPAALGRMAAAAAGKEFAVSTVGVGADFNEFLMTQIADQGAGAYYYLDNPAAFAEMFQKEFLAVKSAAATGIAVSLGLPPGVRIVDASGYPVTSGATRRCSIPAACAPARPAGYSSRSRCRRTRRPCSRSAASRPAIGTTGNPMKFSWRAPSRSPASVTRPGSCRPSTAPAGSIKS